MAAQLRESVGRSVGYRIRGEAKVGRDTRIEIVTEGILTRMLHHDQELPGVGLVIFDEFHERSIHADLGLALTLDVQKHLRPDLRILVMSATLDGVAVADLLGTPSVVESSGRMFPVDTRFAPQASEAPVEQRMADAILRSLRNDEGNILAFLPGIREIRRTEERLMSSRLPEDVHVHLLFGDAGFQQQSDALAPPPPGVRKVILSTSIAETSLTIEGVRVVIDSGLARTSRFEPRRGMSGLVTTPVSKATADPGVHSRAFAIAFGENRITNCFRRIRHRRSRLPILRTLRSTLPAGGTRSVSSCVSSIRRLLRISGRRGDFCNHSELWIAKAK